MPVDKTCWHDEVFQWEWCVYWACIELYNCGDRWLQPESYLDPKQCDIVYNKELKCSWPAVITVQTKDQYGHIVHVPNLRVEVKAVPIMKESTADDNKKQRRVSRYDPNNSILFGGHPPPKLETPYQVTVKDKKDAFHSICMMKVRPNLIDVLFLRSLSDSFQRVERDTNKNKRKNRQTIIWKCYFFKEIFLFLKVIFCFPDFSQLFLMIIIQQHPRSNKSIEYGLRLKLKVKTYDKFIT